MAKIGVAIFMALFMTAVYVGVSSAQQLNSVADPQQQHRSEARPGLLVKAEDLKGKDVIDPSGRKLGKIDSVVLDIANKKISYVAVDPGRAGKLVPVPIEAFGATRERQLVLNVSKNTLDRAPSYAKREKPNWVNEQWTRQVSDYWGGRTPSGTMASTPSASQPATMSSGQSQNLGQQPSNQAQQQPMESNAQQPPGSQSQQQPMSTAPQASPNQPSAR